MFDDIELKEILWHLDMYHNTTSIIVKNVSYSFIARKLKKYFIDIPETKIKEFIEASKEEHNKDKDKDKDMFKYSYSIPRVPVNTNYPKVPSLNLENNKVKTIDDFRRDIYKRPNTERSFDDRMYTPPTPQLRPRKGLYEDSIPDYYKENDHYMSHPQYEEKILPPTWLNKEESLYFNDLTNDQKKLLIDNYNFIKEINHTSSLPLTFQVLLSNIPNNIKADIHNRLVSSQSSILGENQKYINWVKSVLQIPFSIKTKLPDFANNTKQINNYLLDCQQKFDKEVYGHNKIKNEIITIIGSWLKSNSINDFGNVLGITGPVGVGKTTLIKDGLAKAINKPFYFISLGGTSNSSFLQGHGFTYEGSTYGEIARGVIETKTMDPIFYFDELDKIANDSKGEEIIHSLIHLTDPAQNEQFNDRYFQGINLDLSKALYIFSYNDANKINPILRDRIHEISLNDFSINEKTDILSQYIIPKICKSMGLDIKSLLTFEDKTLEYLVELCEEQSGMRLLKLVVIRLLRILNLIDISENEFILNIDKDLIKEKKAPFTIGKDIIKQIVCCTKNTNDIHPAETQYLMYI